MTLHVVAAAIINDRDELLIALRAKHLHQGGLWEFPGGKVEVAETPGEALQRELEEELGIVPEASEPLIKSRYHYSDKSVLLDVWKVTAFRGEAHGREGQQVRWVPRSQLVNYEFPGANMPVLKALELSDRCLITGKFQDQDEFLARLKNALEAGIRVVLLRAKQLEQEACLALAAEAYSMCQPYQAKLLLNCPPQWFSQAKADGLHLTSDELATLQQNPLVEGQMLSASCHDLYQLKKAEELGAGFALLSPVKETSSHPGVPGIGWQQFAEWVDQVSIPVYALGGMTAADLDEAKKQGGQGVAAISEFWKLPG